MLITDIDRSVIEKLLMGPIDQEVAGLCCSQIDEKTFWIAVELNEQWQCKVYRVADLFKIAKATNLDVDVFLALHGCLRNTAMKYFHHISDADCGAFFIKSDRVDVLKALYVYRASSGGVQPANNVIIADDASKERAAADNRYSMSIQHNLWLYRQHYGCQESGRESACI